MAASQGLSLTEELFQATRLNQYCELMKAIHPGEGISEDMFSSSVHGSKFEIDNRLTYKVNTNRKKKTTKTKKVINPNIMFTMFTAFGEKSPGELRKDMVDWIECNKESFKTHVFMAMTAKDMEFDTWFKSVRSNDFIGDEFCLSALCQMCQRHAMVVTSNKIWTTIPPNFKKNEDEIRRLCDVHMLYVCRDTYTILKPVFEWKREVPIGEVSIITPVEVPEGRDPLEDTTHEVLSREEGAQNVTEIKQETEVSMSEHEATVEQFGLINIPPLPSVSRPLPDATTNLLVNLPGADPLVNFESQMDVTRTVPTTNEEGEPMDATLDLHTGDDESDMLSHVIQPSKNTATSIPCSIVLKDVSVKLKGQSYVVFPPSKTEMCKAKVCLKRVDEPKDTLPRLRRRKRKRSLGNQPARSAKSETRYVFSDATSGEETVVNQKVHKKDNRQPSGYRLAAHKYMVAKKHGLIEGPKVRTRALKFTKKNKSSSEDSDATIDYEHEEKPLTKKRKRDQTKGSKVSKGALVTKSYVLRKDGKGTNPRSKTKPRRKRKRSFKCAKCNKHFITVKYLNQHFKDNHRPLQCADCKKFFLTTGALKLHAYTHKDGQLECKECKMTFPFKSQLEQHMPSHSLEQPFKCPEKGCRRRFTHEHDLKKHLKAHEGEEHYCTQCDYSNPDERLLKQHMNKHMRILKYFCKKCKKGFVHSMQLKRHKDRGC